MSELDPVTTPIAAPPVDPFDARLGRAVQAFADRAQTHVDAVAVTELAAGPRRAGPWAILGREVPVPVSLLIVLTLLLAALAWSVAGGAPNRQSAVEPPVPTTLPAVVPRAVPSATAMPPTDGKDDEIVRGTETMAMVADPIETRDGSVTHQRGGEAAVTVSANDHRLTGTGSWRFDGDAGPSVGTEWGTYTLSNDQGAWNGTCRGATWGAGAGASRSCWLTGSGAYAGNTSYLVVTLNGLGSGSVEGVIYPGSPVEP